MRKILILTSKTGGGHVSLAEALRDRLDAGHEFELFDPQGEMVHLHYRLVSRYALWLWAAEFKLLDTTHTALLAHRGFTPFVKRRLRQEILQFRPDLIITTYPFLTYEVMEVLETLKGSIPFVMLFSDPNGVHASWLTEKRASTVLVPTMETFEQALSVGFTQGQLHFVGWPVRGQFYRVDSQKEETLTKLGLDPQRFTVFLQGGGEGAARFGRTVERVLAVDPHLQVILATGTNEALYERFKHVENLYALPFTREIALFMAAADVVMGKSGPNMLFEAVTLGKPFIATAYIPGQEYANLEFIRRHALGWIALTAEEQEALLGRLIADRGELAAKVASVEKYRAWNAAANKKIAPLIESLLPRD